jgi:hypothetical protein
VDVTETSIGNFERSERGGKQDLVVYGHQMYGLHDCSSLLTGIGVTIDCSDKFRTEYSKASCQMLQDYCDYIEMEPDEANELLTKLKNINENRMLVIPFKPGTLFTLVGDDGKKKEAKLSSIRWLTNKETYKIECSLIFKSKFDEKFIFSVTEYIEKFYLSGVEIRKRSSKYDPNIIKMSSYGIIHPIEVTDGEMKAAIDGTYLYYISSDKAHIVGKWDSNGNLKVSKGTSAPCITKILDNLEYIKDNRKYIAPYKLFEPNVIEIKKKKTK